jgi:hypothetical protein
MVFKLGMELEPIAIPLLAGHIASEALFRVELGAVDPDRVTHHYWQTINHL